MISTQAIPAIPNVLMDGLATQGSILSQFKRGAVLYIDVIDFANRARFAPQACDEVVQQFTEGLHDLRCSDLPVLQDVVILEIGYGCFTFLFPHIATFAQGVDVLRSFVELVQTHLNAKRLTTRSAPVQLRYGVSHSECLENSDPNRQLYQLVACAARSAQSIANPKSFTHQSELQIILKSKNVTSYYQPIVELQTKKVLGFENLSRGPEGSSLEHPVELFQVAEEFGYLLELERLCRNEGIRRARVGSDEKLFLNVSPNILFDPMFRVGDTRKVLEECGLTPAQVVFEITEHRAIDDYPAFLQLVDHYRDQGYQIAIDDLGSGYSGLVTLVQVKPEFVKIDTELIRDIDQNPTKQDIVRAICDIARGFSGTVIAEGIETIEEQSCAQSCGVQYGQGYLLGRPREHESLS
ncbi:EAL domain-containing protein [Alicyclobacillus acidiphilus]|uniref:EAL domain-containing protein n=1 Tax=Alicyclobacillus acidiphilus TaxID=182455 RepID=UPI001470814E|nr:EAL domain-containing protein [Alicyclobacillus acidiphilus]